jgi:protein disulfide-isomerase-like protein
VAKWLTKDTRIKNDSLSSSFPFYKNESSRKKNMTKSVIVPIVLTIIHCLVFVLCKDDINLYYSPLITTLTSSNFEQKVQNQKSNNNEQQDNYWFIKFYAPWCGHCQYLAPIWSELSSQLETSSMVHLGKVDCTKNNDICDKYNVRGYPTLLFFKNGEVVGEYEGKREVRKMLEWTEKMTSVPKFDGNAIQLTDSNFEETLREYPNGYWFIKFYSPNCVFCQDMAQTWIDFATEMKGTNVMVAEVNALNEKKLAEMFKITSYPIIIFLNGKKMTSYTGLRNVAAFKEFAQNQWKGATFTERPVLTPNRSFFDGLFMILEQSPVLSFLLILIIIVTIILCSVMVLCLLDNYETEPIRKTFANRVPASATKINNPSVDMATPTVVSSDISTGDSSSIRARPSKDKDY